MKALFAQPTILLGKYGSRIFERALRLTVPEIRTHAHVIGISGSGKSRMLAGLYLALHRVGLSATLIDPHGDLARLILSHLIADGAFKNKDAYKKILYLDILEASRREMYLPLNVLKQAGNPYVTASNIMEAMHRTWPSLSAGAAPMFDTLIQNSVKALTSNNLPLPALYRFLTDKDYRNAMLKQEEDQDVVSLFHDWYDKLAAKDQMDQAGSTLRRVNLITFDPVLKYSLGQEDNAINFRHIIDNSIFTIINLAIDNAEARRLMGSLLTVSAEQAALSRSELPPEERTGSHHLIIDEFSEFSAQSEEALSRILSLTRKYGLYVVMAHQTWSQASARLQGALQNVGVEVIFRLGRQDADLSAKTLGHVDPMEVKHEVADENAVDRTHPVFYSLPEQWEGWVQNIQGLGQRQAYISYHRHLSRFDQHILKRKAHRVEKVRTVPVPDAAVGRQEVQAVEEEYLRRYFKPLSVITEEIDRYHTVEEEAPISRTRTDYDEGK